MTTTGRKTADERKQMLAELIANRVVQGYRVETQSDFQAIIIKGKPVNHILHLILSIFTLGIWLFVWLLLAITGGEKREIARVDEWGTTSVAKV